MQILGKCTLVNIWVKISNIILQIPTLAKSQLEKGSTRPVVPDPNMFSTRRKRQSVHTILSQRGRPRMIHTCQWEEMPSLHVLPTPEPRKEQWDEIMTVPYKSVKSQVPGHLIQT